MKAIKEWLSEFLDAWSQSRLADKILSVMSVVVTAVIIFLILI